MSSVAAIDIGSNSVRLLIVGPDGGELSREMQITRLAEGVDRSGRLAEAAMTRTLDVLASYGALIRRHGAERVRVTGTSAARDAQNRDEFFARVERAIGRAPELLSGGAEAALAFAGATAGRAAEQGPFLTLDIGGGSTEFAFGTSSPEHAISLDIGCVRITERFLLEDPPSPRELAEGGAFVRSLLERVEREVPCRRARTWLGLAGTVTSLAARDAGLTRYDPSVTHGYRLTRARVEALHAELAARDLAGRRELLLEPKRASVILGGSLILVEVMRWFELDHIVASERDILDGLAASLLDGQASSPGASRA
jgi:exopolyphosphatase/guanosine-5'-triphosphate,3'-diphosphate pyrophosphatase